MNLKIPRLSRPTRRSNLNQMFEMDLEGKLLTKQTDAILEKIYNAIILPLDRLWFYDNEVQTMFDCGRYTTARWRAKKMLQGEKGGRYKYSRYQLECLVTSLIWKDFDHNRNLEKWGLAPAEAERLAEGLRYRKNWADDVIAKLEAENERLRKRLVEQERETACLKDENEQARKRLAGLPSLSGMFSGFNIDREEMERFGLQHGLIKRPSLPDEDWPKSSVTT